MKIMLINSAGKFSEYESIRAPLGIMYLGAVLENEGYNVRLLDSCKSITNGNPYNEVVLENFRKFKPDVVGISALTPIYPLAKEIAANIKNIDDVPILIGGAHPSALPDETLADENVDIVVRGEGEATIVELIEKLENGKSLEDVKGISFKNGGKIVHNPLRPLIKDLDSIPFPARHLLPMDDYKTMTMMTSRGCPYNCIYCFKIDGPNFRARSPENVVSEIEEIIEKYGNRKIYFHDDLFTFNAQRVMDICALLIKRGVDAKFVCESRVNTVSKDMLKSLKEAGCVAIHFGVESGDQRILDLINKKITVQQARDAFKFTREVGLYAHGYFMIGFPWDTHESVRKTIKLANEIADTAQFALVTPYPGTKMWEIAKERGMLNNLKWEGLFTVTPTQWDVDLQELKDKPIFESSELTKEDLLNYMRIAHTQMTIKQAKRNPIKYIFSSVKKPGLKHCFTYGTKYFKSRLDIMFHQT